MSTHAALTCFHTLKRRMSVSECLLRRRKKGDALGVACLSSSVDRSLVLAEVDESRGETGPVGDTREE